MRLASYLPSGQFSVLAGSLTLAAGLVIGAQYITGAPAQPSFVESAAQTADQGDWRAALDAIQASAPTLPPAPSPDVTKTLLAGAKTNNLTDTVARTLLVNLSSASSQGLGTDIPTQDGIIASAVAQLPQTAPEKVYGAADLSTVADSKDSQHTYGDAVMVVLSHHTSATTKATLYALDQALEQNDPQALDDLARLQDQYAALTQELSAVPTPKTLVPLHLQALNSLGAVAASFEGLALATKDPLQALQGLQQYNQNIGKVGGVFTAISENLSKNGILFTKDEPGAAWAVFSAPDTP